MAASRFSSNTPDAVDVRYVLQAFQHINRVKIEIRIGVLEHEGEPLLAMEIAAHEASVEVGDQSSLASVKLKLGYKESHQMEAVILRALYKLDAELAEHELARSDRK